MSAFRHLLLLTDEWEIQCPVCWTFALANRAIFRGEEAFPPHLMRDEPKACGFRNKVNWAKEDPPAGLARFGPLV